MEKLTTSVTRLNVPYHLESYVNTHPLQLAFLDHFQISVTLIISWLNSIVSLLHHMISSFICFLRQQTAQDTLYIKPRPPTEHCICSEQISLVCNVRPFDRKCVPRRSQETRSKNSLSVRLSCNMLDWICKSPPKRNFKHLFLEGPLLKAIMSGNEKSPPEGLKDSECEQGTIINWPPIPYVQPADLNEKQEKTEIKLKLPDGTYYQMVPF